MSKIIKRLVDSITPLEKDQFFWDSEIKGFGLRVFPTGRKSYLVQYRAGGRTRRMTIGQHGVLTPDEARKEARELLVDVIRGGNPSEEKRTRSKASNMGELCDRFLKEHVAHHCRPTTQKEYARNVEKFIKPALGTFKVIDVSKLDIIRLHEAHKHIPYQANRTLGILSILFNKAEDWGLRPENSNPTFKVKKYPEEKRERFLTPDELRRLFITLRNRLKDHLESPYLIAGIKLLLLTGCRLGEIQKLEWSMIRGNAFHLPDSKTGKKKVYVGKVALDILADLEPVDSNPYVIVGKVDGGYITDFQKPWRRIRAQAGIEDVRIHDLRHTYASYAVSGGMSLHMTGKLLGHSQAQTTQRYAHLADAPMHQAADEVADRIMDCP